MKEVDMYCLFLSVIPRVFFHGAIVAAILTWGPDWTRKKFFELHKATTKLFIEKLRQGGPSLKMMAPNGHRFMDGTYTRYEDLDKLRKSNVPYTPL